MRDKISGLLLMASACFMGSVFGSGLFNAGQLVVDSPAWAVTEICANDKCACQDCQCDPCECPCDAPWVASTEPPSAPKIVQGFDMSEPRIYMITSDWCAPCKQYQRPIIDRLHAQGYPVLVVNAEKSPELATAAGFDPTKGFPQITAVCEGCDHPLVFPDARVRSEAAIKQLFGKHPSASETAAPEPVVYQDIRSCGHSQSYSAPTSRRPRRRIFRRWNVRPAAAPLVRSSCGPGGGC